jgi:hypothetical protein
MKVWAFLLAASVTVNLWLGWRLVHNRHPESRQATLAKAVAAKPGIHPGLPVTSPGGALRGTAARFSWQMLEATNSHEYAARLRQAGCPEHVVQGLVLDQLCYARDEKLARVPPIPSWSDPVETRAAKLRIFNARQAIRQEFDALGREILGVHCVESVRFEDLVLSDALLSFLIGPLPEDRLSPCAFAMRRYENISSDLDQLPPIAAWREAQKLKNPWPGLPEGLLTAQQQQQFSVRSIAFMMIMARDRAEAEVFEWSPAELQRVSEAVGRVAPATLSFDVAKEDIDFDALRPVLAAALSSDRAEQWERSLDSDFRDAAGCLREAGLPVSTADAVHRVKRETEANWLQLLGNPNLQELERDSAAEQVRMAAATTVRQLLGPAFEAFKNGKRHWMLLQEGAQ